MTVRWNFREEHRSRAVAHVNGDEMVSKGSSLFLGHLVRLGPALEVPANLCRELCRFERLPIVPEDLLVCGDPGLGP